MRKTMLVAIAMAFAPLLFASSAGAAELRLHGGGHFQGAGQPFVEAFTEKTGIAASYTPGNTGGGGFLRRLNAGEQIDVIVLNREDMGRQVEAGLIKPDSAVNFARDGYGVAVLEGMPKPDISTPEKLRTALLAANAVGRQEPDPAHHSGIIVQQFLIDLGILDEMEEKTVIITDSTSALVEGKADFVIWSFTEILRNPDLEAAGPIPAELGGYVTQAVGIPESSQNVANAEAFIQFITSADGEAVYSNWGMEALPQE